MAIYSDGKEAEGFNTQPPEGGWRNIFRRVVFMCRFNTQPPEGGWCV